MQARQFLIMYIAHLPKSRRRSQEVSHMGEGKWMSNSILHESQHQDTHCTHLAGLRTHTLGLLTQSSRLTYMGPESSLFQVKSLKSIPPPLQWIPLCYWEVPERLTDTGISLVQQSFNDWKRCLLLIKMQTPTQESEGHKQSERHTTTKWTKETQWDTVNHQIQRAMELHPLPDKRSEQLP